MNQDHFEFRLLDWVEKTGWDYTFEGQIRAKFQKVSGAYRYVVEDDRGALHIYSAKNLRLVQCMEA